MHSLQSLRELRNLDHLLGVLPDEPHCDSYPSLGMTLRDMHEAYHRRTPQPTAPQGRVFAVARYNLATRQITVEEVPQPVEAPVTGYVEMDLETGDIRCYDGMPPANSEAHE